MQKLNELSYEIVFEQLISVLHKDLPQELKARNPRFEHSRPNRLRIYLDGIAGSHYEICFRQAYHEFALHFESTPARNMERRQYFDSHLDDLSKSVSVLVKSGPLENKGWMRVWFQFNSNPITPDLVSKYSSAYTTFMINTFPILSQTYYL